VISTKAGTGVGNWSSQSETREEVADGFEKDLNRAMTSVPAPWAVHGSDQGRVSCVIWPMSVLKATVS